MEKNAQYFELLKHKIEQQLIQSHPHISKSIVDWTANEIVLLQEDLLEKTQGKISEKWFYTHIKNTADKLPRIDTLNLLANYCGYKGFDDLIYQESKSEEKTPTIEVPIKKEKKARTYPTWVVPAIFLSVGVLLVYLYSTKENRCEFCFQDENYKLIVGADELQIQLLKEGESPIELKADRNNCVRFNTEEDQAKFVYSSPYYINDTITRKIYSDPHFETVRLKSDDIALMVNYFGNNDVENWSKHRNKLKALFHADAKILKVQSNLTGLRLYELDEFINHLSIPSEAMKNFRVKSIKQAGDKIKFLKFSLDNE